MHEFILHEQAQCLHTRRHTQFHACKKKEEERKAIFKSSHGLVDVVGPFQLIKAFMCSSCALHVSGDVYLLSWVKLEGTTIPLMPWSTSLWSVCPVISGSISFLTLIYFYKNLMSSNWIFTASLSSNMLSKTEKKSKVSLCIQINSTLSAALWSLHFFMFWVQEARISGYFKLEAWISSEVLFWSLAAFSVTSLSRLACN